MRRKAAWSCASSRETTISRSCEGACKSRRELWSGVGGRCTEQAVRWEAAAAARRRWGEEAADVRRQHLLRACSAPAQRGEEGGGWCHCCCIVIEQDKHDSLLRKLTLPFPPITASSETGSGSPGTPARGQRKSSERQAEDLGRGQKRRCRERCATLPGKLRRLQAFPPGLRLAAEALVKAACYSPRAPSPPGVSDGFCNPESREKRW